MLRHIPPPYQAQPNHHMIAFVHLSKTAGSTFKNVLRRSFGVHHCDAIATNPDKIFRDSDLKLAEKLYPDLWSLSSHHFKDPIHTLSAPLDYVTFIRDPLKRTASQYQHRMRERDIKLKGMPPSFDKWLEAEAANFQIHQLSGSEDVDEALRILREKFLFVGLTETYADSLRDFAALSPWPISQQIEKRNVAPDSSIKDKILKDPGSRRLMQEANAADIELYERVRDELLPEQTERAKAAAEMASRKPFRNRYLDSRIFTNIAYRPAVKLRRSLLD